MHRRPVIGIATQTLEAIAGQVPLAWVMGQKYVRVPDRRRPLGNQTAPSEAPMHREYQRWYSEGVAI